jgi:hypothetical protein
MRVFTGKNKKDLYLSILGKDYPGITEVKRNEGGSIPLDI